MTWWNLQRWALRATLGNPWFTLLGLALAAVWPLVAVLTGLGVTSGTGTPGAIWGQLGLLAVGIGVVFGAGLADRLAWVLDRSALGSRATALLALHGVPAALLLAGAWAVPVLVGTGPVRFALVAQLLALAVGGLHLLVLARVTAWLGFSGPRTWVGVLGLAWFLPALLGGAGTLGRVLAHPLDVQQTVRMVQGGPFGLQSLLALLPIIGWAVLLGLSHHSTRPHALRSPR